MYITHCAATLYALFPNELLRFFFVKLCSYLCHSKMCSIVHTCYTIMYDYYCVTGTYIYLHDLACESAYTITT